MGTTSNLNLPQQSNWTTAEVQTWAKSINDEASSTNAFKIIDDFAGTVVTKPDASIPSRYVPVSNGNGGYSWQEQSRKANFLSFWNCSTGLATDVFATLPYTYQKGDYYRITNIASGYTHNLTLNHNDGSALGMTIESLDSDEYTITDICSYLEENGYISSSKTYEINGLFKYSQSEYENAQSGYYDTTNQVLHVLGYSDRERDFEPTELEVIDGVSGGITNYKPNGTTYSGTSSQTTESNYLQLGMIYYYDGYYWKLDHTLFNTTEAGLVPPSGTAETDKFLCSDGTWSHVDTTIPVASSTTVGGVKVIGTNGVQMTGTNSDELTLTPATSSQIGGVSVGEFLSATNGKIEVERPGCLGFWNCETGLADTKFYDGSSYTYKKGDYFRITNINSYKHSIYLQWGDISNNCYATVVINNNSLTAFTGDTLKSWLQTNGYTNNTKYTNVTGHYQTTAFSSDLYAVSYNTSSGNGNWWRTDIPTSGVQAWFGAFRSDTITGNQIPAGSSYNGTASTTRASVPLQDGQIYYYNGSSWQLEYIIDTTPTANSTHLITSGGVKSAIDAKPTVSGTNDGTNWTSITIDGNTKQIASNYVLPPATAGALGGILSQTTGTTAERDYVVEVDNTGNAKVNVPWTDTTYSTFTTSAAGLVPASSGSGETNKYLRGDGTWQDVSVTSGVASVNGKTGTVVLDETDIGITDFTAQEISDIFDEVINVEVHADTITDAFVSIEDYDPTETANEGVLYYVTD